LIARLSAWFMYPSKFPSDILSLYLNDSPWPQCS
jgi:hypothetical protein